jgi:hypothetical protein
MLRGDFAAQGCELIPRPRHQDQIPAARRKSARKTGANAARGAGDQSELVSCGRRGFAFNIQTGHDETSLLRIG